MENFLLGLRNFLYLIENNWTLILVVVGLSLKIGRDIKKYLKLSEQEKIDLALANLKEIMIVLCTEAELGWSEYKKSGSVKRAEVIDRIFKEYPILLKVTNQEQLIKDIDKLIDEALVEVRKVVEGIEGDK